MRPDLPDQPPGPHGAQLVEDLHLVVRRIVVQVVRELVDQLIPDGASGLQIRRRGRAVAERFEDEGIAVLGPGDAFAVPVRELALLETAGEVCPVGRKAVRINGWVYPTGATTWIYVCYSGKRKGSSNRPALYSKTPKVE